VGPAALRLAVYTREGCHLCEEMIAELGAWLEGSGLGVSILDVDADPAACARFGLMVPVLTVDGEPVCSGRFDPDVMEELIERAGPGAPQV
jgi:predicted thioredoxin/glutaredoxin